MRKSLLTLLISLIAITAVSASPEFYIRPNFLVTYDTNVFSSPLPQTSLDEDHFSQSSWLNSPEYIKRWELGLFLDTDIFFASDGITGLSVSFMMNAPIASTSYERHKNDVTDLIDYKKRNSLDEQDPAFSFGIGPIFRGQLGKTDLGIAIRLSAGSYNLFRNSFNLGLQVEPYLLVPISEQHWFFSCGFVFDAHFYNFLIGDPEKIYTDYFFRLTVGGYAGFAFRWGGDV